ncbi:zinc finger RNA-binding protein isoform X1 [Pieris rapae]|uniref:zinc finger RNA-binding protein isoform X1 n=1 Tax=Pieris rapae TaxID=64459 RepID=UPI001E27E055|nr:zinc finger RNA-binding protein isoform X1 [Pieris rapae]
MMAANNYFGFTHGGTQYGAATAGAAYGGQTGYAVAPAATAATYGTQRAAATGYDTAYQAAAATQAAAHAHAHAAAAAASAYDASKSAYYQQAAAAYPTAAPQPQPAYDATAKPTYSTPATYAQNNIIIQGGGRAGGGAKAAYGGVYTATTAAATYPAQPYTAPAAQQAKPATNRGTSAYDTALYNAATMYVAQQNKTAANPGWKNYNKSGVGAGQPRRPKPPPKAQQLHYCDVCRISCAGPQTYKEHLEGQKHKKKEAAAKAGGGGGGGAGGRGSGGAALRCELCDVTCTGADAYAAHVRGIKHQKVVKLHTMLGKPIPSTEPTKLSSASNAVGGAAKIAFVARGGLSSVTVGAPADKAEERDDDDGEEVQPVGQDYIEEIRGDDGKPHSFNCKLCDCKFNDPNAKEMHMKGRRHRLQYKKKVQPDLEVKVKPSMHQRKLAEAKAQRMLVRDEMWARRRMHEGMEDEERAYWEGGAEAWWARGPLPPHMHHHHHGMGMGMGFASMGRRPETSDDRHVVARHAEIYPEEQELQQIQRVVSHTEKALKSLSDALADQALAKGSAKPSPKVEDKKDEKPEGKEDGRDNQLFSFMGEGEGGGGGESGAGPSGAPSRALKGVMRVGLLAKGLLLRGDRDVRLVVLCHDRPTVTLLKRVAADLPGHLQRVKTPGDEAKHKVELLPAEGAVQVSEGAVHVLVSLTSAVMREPAEGGDAKRDDKDVLPRQKCLDALAALRHAKWFQARAASLQSCVIIIRIMRDLCRRIPNWTPLNPYAMELLVSGVMQSAGTALSPGEALRRVMEAVAGGLLLEHGPGLRDPCEKELVDALGNLAPQQREDLTASAQQFLRQIAFRQIHKVLDMEPLPKVKAGGAGAGAGSAAWKFPRKRRRSNTDADHDTPNGEGKIVKTEEAKAEPADKQPVKK